MTMVRVEAYKDGRYAGVDIDLSLWHASHGEVLDAALAELARRLPGGIDAYLAHGPGVRRFGGRVRGGPADGDNWGRDADYWRLPVAERVSTRIDEATNPTPAVRTANYRWTPTGWEWDGYQD